MSNHLSVKSLSNVDIVDTGDKTQIAKKLLFLIEEFSGRVFPLFDGLVVGRFEGDQRFESDNLLSRRHCQFFLKGRNNQWSASCQDLGSTNGTRVNGKQIAQGERVTLKIGDTIEIGGQRFALSDVSRRILRNSHSNLPIKPSFWQTIIRFLDPTSWNGFSASVVVLLWLFNFSYLLSLKQDRERIQEALFHFDDVYHQLFIGIIITTLVASVILYRLLNYDCHNWLSRIFGTFSGLAFYLFLLMMGWSGPITKSSANILNEDCLTHFSMARCAVALKKASSGIKQLPSAKQKMILDMLEDLRNGGTIKPPRSI